MKLTQTLPAPKILIERENDYEDVNEEEPLANRKKWDTVHNVTTNWNA